MSGVQKKGKQHPAELTITDIGTDTDRWFDAVITADVVDKQGERLDPHGFTLKEYRDILKAPIIDTHSNVTVGQFDPKSLKYDQVRDPHTGTMVNAIVGRGRIHSAKEGYEEYPVWRQVWDHIKEHAQRGKPAALSIGGDPDPDVGKKVVCKDGSCHIFVPKVFWHETSIVRDERGGANPLATVGHLNRMAKGQVLFGSALLKFGVDSSGFQVVKANRKLLPDAYYRISEHGNPAKGREWGGQASEKNPNLSMRQYANSIGEALETGDEDTVRFWMHHYQNDVQSGVAPPGWEPQDFGRMRDAYRTAWRGGTTGAFGDWPTDKPGMGESERWAMAAEDIRRKNAGEPEDPRDETFIRGTTGEALHDARGAAQASRATMQGLGQAAFGSFAESTVPARTGKPPMPRAVPQPPDEERSRRFSSKPPPGGQRERATYGPGGQGYRPSDKTEWMGGMPGRQPSQAANKSEFQVIKAVREPEAQEDAPGLYLKPDRKKPQQPSLNMPKAPATPPEKSPEPQPGIDPYSGESQSSTPPPVPQHLARESVGSSRPPQVPQAYRMEAPNPKSWARDVHEEGKRIRSEEREQHRTRAREAQAQRATQGLPPKPEDPRVRSGKEVADLAQLYREELPAQIKTAEETLTAMKNQNGSADEIATQQAVLDGLNQKMDQAIQAYKAARAKDVEYRTGLFGKDDPRVYQRYRSLRGTPHEYKGGYRILKAATNPVGSDDWLIDELGHAKPTTELHTTETKEGLGSGTAGTFQARVGDDQHIVKRKVPTDPYAPPPPTVRKPAQEMRERTMQGLADMGRFQRQSESRSAAEEARAAQLKDPKVVGDPKHQQRLAQWYQGGQAGPKPEPAGLTALPAQPKKPDDVLAPYRTGPPPRVEPTTGNATTGGRYAPGLAPGGQDPEHRGVTDPMHATLPEGVMEGERARRMAMEHARSHGEEATPEELMPTERAGAPPKPQRAPTPESRVIPGGRAGLRTQAQRDELMRQRTNAAEAVRVNPGDEKARERLKATDEQLEQLGTMSPREGPAQGPQPSAPSTLLRPRTEDPSLGGYGGGGYLDPGARAGGQMREVGREALREATEQPRPEGQLPQEIREPGVAQPEQFLPSAPGRKPPTEPHSVRFNPRVQSQGKPLYYAETEEALEPSTHVPLGNILDEDKLLELRDQLKQAGAADVFDQAEAGMRQARSELDRALVDPNGTPESKAAAEQQFTNRMRAADDMLTRAMDQVPQARYRGTLTQEARKIRQQLIERYNPDAPGGPTAQDQPGISRREKDIIGGKLAAPIPLEGIQIAEKPRVLDRPGRQHPEFDLINIENPDEVRGLIEDLPAFESTEAQRQDLVELVQWVASMGDATQAIGNLDAAGSALLAHSKMLADAGNQPNSTLFQNLAQRANRAAALLRTGKLGRAAGGAFGPLSQALFEATDARRQARSAAEMARRASKRRGELTIEEVPIMRKDAQGNVVPGVPLDEVLAKVGDYRFNRERYEQSERIFNVETGAPLREKVAPDHREPNLPGLQDFDKNPRAVRRWLTDDRAIKLPKGKASPLKAADAEVKAWFNDLITKAMPLLAEDPALEAQFGIWISTAWRAIAEARLRESDMKHLDPKERAKYEEMREGTKGDPAKELSPQALDALSEDERTAYFQERLKRKSQKAPPKVKPLEVELEHAMAAMQRFELPSPDIEGSQSRFFGLPTARAFYRILAAKIEALPEETTFRGYLDQLESMLMERDPEFFVQMTAEERADELAIESAIQEQQWGGANYQRAPVDPGFEQAARGKAAAGQNPFSPTAPKGGEKPQMEATPEPQAQAEPTAKNLGRIIKAYTGDKVILSAN